MRSQATQAFLERFVTGETCELTGCYNLAVWLVSFNDQTSHWCSKHTRMHMRDQGHWGRLVGAEIER